MHRILIGEAFQHRAEFFDFVGDIMLFHLVKWSTRQVIKFRFCQTIYFAQLPHHRSKFEIADGTTKTCVIPSESLENISYNIIAVFPAPIKRVFNKTRWSKYSGTVCRS